MELFTLDDFKLVIWTHLSNHLWYIRRAGPVLDLHKIPVKTAFNCLPAKAQRLPKFCAIVNETLLLSWMQAKCSLHTEATQAVCRLTPSTLAVLGWGFNPSIWNDCCSQQTQSSSTVTIQVQPSHCDELWGTSGWAGCKVCETTFCNVAQLSTYK